MFGGGIILIADRCPKIADYPYSENGDLPPMVFAILTRNDAVSIIPITTKK